MFRASLCPSSGEQDRDYCIWCSALVVWSWDVSCVHCVKVTVRLSHRQCTQLTDPAPHKHNQHSQCRTPHAVVHGLVLLMMVIMMPETRWDRSLIIGLVAPCLFLSLRLTFLMHGHKNLKLDPNSMKHFYLLFYSFREATHNLSNISTALLRHKTTTREAIFKT